MINQLKSNIIGHEKNKTCNLFYADAWGVIFGVLTIDSSLICGVTPVLSYEIERF